MDLKAKILALKLPGDQIISPPPNFKPEFNSLGSVITGFLNLAFLLSAFVMLLWATWGVFDYLLARGEKENIAKARGKIQWAIIGFIVVIVAFAGSQYVKEFFINNFTDKDHPVPVTSISEPVGGSSVPKGTP